jgi:hypothetical protein
MGFTIKSATWGDERSSTDVTQSMVDKAKSGYLDFVADNTIVPVFDIFGSKTVTLDDNDNQTIKSQAISACNNNAADTKCIEFQTNQLETQFLQKKTAEAQSSANIITGRRLTLTIIDDNGMEKVLAVPDGQKVQIGDKPKVTMPETFSGGTSTLLWGIIKILISMSLTLLWVFSIAAPYRIFVLEGKLMTAYILTGLAILIPYSGLITTPVMLGYYKWMAAAAPVSKVPV